MTIFFAVPYRFISFIILKLYLVMCIDLKNQQKKKKNALHMKIFGGVSDQRNDLFVYYFEHSHIIIIIIIIVYEV